MKALQEKYNEQGIIAVPCSFDARDVVRLYLTLLPQNAPKEIQEKVTYQLCSLYPGKNPFGNLAVQFVPELAFFWGFPHDDFYEVGNFSHLRLFPESLVKDSADYPIICYKTRALTIHKEGLCHNFHKY